MDMASASPGGFLSGVSRRRAVSVQLLISSVIAGCAMTLMLAVWYPPPFFEVLGGGGLVFILIGVNVVIGPMVTLVIFKPGKPGLKFDLVVIALLQMSALIYGMYVIAAARPAFIVLVKDQFEVVAATDLSSDQLASAQLPQFRRLPLTGPSFVYSDAPTTGEAHRKLVLSAVSGGPDIQGWPEYYRPLDGSRKQALGYSHTLEYARTHWQAAVPVIERYLARTGRKPDEIRYLAGRAPRGWFICLLDAATGSVLTCGVVEVVAA